MPAELLYAYETAISGFSAKLSTKQLESLQKVNGFLSATPDQMLTLHTTNSHQFLGLQMGKGLWAASNLASDVIIGIVDTGIWPEHISFQDTGMSDVPSRWKGDCEEGTEFSKSNCNKKLIGARAFFKGYEASRGRMDEIKEYRSARDKDGHGTHAASIAAGGLVANANFSGLAKGQAAGTSYTSRIAVYKVCWRFGCFGSDMLAAIDKAVQDGVDVLSMSLGSGSLPFHKDMLAVGSFGAVKSGVFVSSSAGNSGPSSSSLSNSAPWIMSVAASYTDRTFSVNNDQVRHQLVRSDFSDKKEDGILDYSGFNRIIGIGHCNLIHPAILHKNSDLLAKRRRNQFLIPFQSIQEQEKELMPHSASKFCLNGTLNETLVTGKIVVCEGAGGNKYEKSENVKQAKGVGMILINSVGDELIADPHILPTARVGNTTGGNFICPKNGAIRGSELNYPSFAVNFRGGVQNGSLESKRTVTNVGIPTSSYAVQVEVPNGVSVIRHDVWEEFAVLSPGGDYSIHWCCNGQKYVHNSHEQDQGGGKKTKMVANLFRQGDSMQTYQAVIDSINEMSLQEGDVDQQEETIIAELLYASETAISGFSAKLSTKQLQSLKKVDGFLSATPDQMLQLHTTNSKQFLGLQNGKGLLFASNSAFDVIIGIIDTGIWPEHISFQDTGMSAVPSRWKGVCEKGTRFSKSNCNKKLIGARAFFKGYGADQGKINEAKVFRSAQDEDGHDMLAAIDKAVQDGVDVLSLSLGSGPTPFHSDILAIGSFGAIKSGVFVSSSAGHSGTFRSSVSNSAPWMMTVAASYTDRTFPAIIKLGNGKTIEGVATKLTEDLETVLMINRD
ncbi:hypothetical protein LWI29_035551 [Acer saccharum]|uniref:Uncharacterized protein n=1 Tax=Acer saccharum TaxID=4024 RepID=A0AA39VMI8_ACESA|nr:hypothetical protein LWI29_035551 [Acer saccharum]